MKKPATHVIARNKATSELCRSGVNALLYVLTVLLLYFIPLNVSGQNNIQKADTVKAKLLDSTVDKEALYVIDGQVSINKLDSINPNDILEVVILKKEKISDPSFQPLHDIVVVVTKTYAVLQYQEKFSAFSKEYRDYLKQHKNYDRDVVYILNAVPVMGKENEIIEALYKIKTGEIKNVEFRPSPQGEHGSAVVIIKTKK
jgi:hypothetical protein